MDKLLPALIDAIKTSGPLAATAVKWYLLVDLLEWVVGGLTWIVIIWMITACVKWCVNKACEDR